eukprot:IDg638t1
MISDNYQVLECYNPHNYYSNLQPVAIEKFRKRFEDNLQVSRVQPKDTAT